jgi:hypothetical protein
MHSLSTFGLRFRIQKLISSFGGEEALQLVCHVVRKSSLSWPLWTGLSENPRILNDLLPVGSPGLLRSQ